MTAKIFRYELGVTHLKSRGGQRDDQSRHNASLFISAKPDADRSSCYPNDTHRRVLIISGIPIRAPTFTQVSEGSSILVETVYPIDLPMLCESVHNTPRSNDPTVIPLLASLTLQKPWPTDPQ